MQARLQGTVATTGLWRVKQLSVDAADYQTQWELFLVRAGATFVQEALRILHDGTDAIILSPSGMKLQCDVGPMTLAPAGDLVLAPAGSSIVDIDGATLQLDNAFGIYMKDSGATPRLVGYVDGSDAYHIGDSNLVKAIIDTPYLDLNSKQIKVLAAQTVASDAARADHPHDGTLGGGRRLPA
jgi:hypothetical protein